MSILLATLFAILFAQTSNAALDATVLPPEPGFDSSHECQSVDYRSDLGSYRDQGETGYCFAYSSADLIHQRTGIQVSALDLAMRFYFADAAMIRSAPEDLLREYLLAHPQVENEIREYRLSNDVDVLEHAHPMFHNIAGGFEAPTLLLANLGGLCPEKSFASVGGLISHSTAIRQMVSDALAGRVEVGPEADVIENRFRDPEADRFNTAWLRYVDGLCGDRRQKSPLALVPVEYRTAFDLIDFYRKLKNGEISGSERRKLISALDFALNRGRIAAVGYDLAKFLDPRSPEVQKYAGRGEPGDGDHSSPIVARRMEKGRCQYLVRDPSGFQCQDYLPKFRSRCHNHHLWVYEDELSESLYDLVYLR